MGGNPCAPTPRRPWVASHGGAFAGESATPLGGEDAGALGAEECGAGEVGELAGAPAVGLGAQGDGERLGAAGADDDVAHGAGDAGVGDGDLGVVGVGVEADGLRGAGPEAGGGGAEALGGVVEQAELAGLEAVDVNPGVGGAEGEGRIGVAEGVAEAARAVAQRLPDGGGFQGDHLGAVRAAPGDALAGGAPALGSVGAVDGACAHVGE